MIRRYGIDTSVLVRLLAGDPEKDFSDAIVPQAHLFVIFFCAISAIAQPTASTSYAAAAQSSVVPKSVEAVKLALPAFVRPYAFVANSTLLTIGTATEVTLTIFFAVGSMVAMGMAVQATASGTSIPSPAISSWRQLGPDRPVGVQWNLIGPAFGVSLTGWEWFRARRRAAATGA